MILGILDFILRLQAMSKDKQAQEQAQANFDARMAQQQAATDATLAAAKDKDVRAALKEMGGGTNRDAALRFIKSVAPPGTEQNFIDFMDAITPPGAQGQFKKAQAQQLQADQMQGEAEVRMRNDAQTFGLIAQNPALNQLQAPGVQAFGDQLPAGGEFRPGESVPNPAALTLQNFAKAFEQFAGPGGPGSVSQFETLGVFDTPTERTGTMVPAQQEQVEAGVQLANEQARRAGVATSREALGLVEDIARATNNPAMAPMLAKMTMDSGQLPYDLLTRLNVPIKKVRSLESLIKTRDKDRAAATQFDVDMARFADNKDVIGSNNAILTRNEVAGDLVEQQILAGRPRSVVQQEFKDRARAVGKTPGVFIGFNDRTQPPTLTEIETSQGEIVGAMPQRITRFIPPEALGDINPEWLQGIPASALREGARIVILENGTIQVTGEAQSAPGEFRTIFGADEDDRVPDDPSDVARREGRVAPGASEIKANERQREMRVAAESVIPDDTFADLAASAGFRPNFVRVARDKVIREKGEKATFADLEQALIESARSNQRVDFGLFDPLGGDLDAIANIRKLRGSVRRKFGKNLDRPILSGTAVKRAGRELRKSRQMGGASPLFEGRDRNLNTDELSFRQQGVPGVSPGSPDELEFRQIPDVLGEFYRLPREVQVFRQHIKSASNERLSEMRDNLSELVGPKDPRFKAITNELIERERGRSEQLSESPVARQASKQHRARRARLVKSAAKARKSNISRLRKMVGPGPDAEIAIDIVTQNLRKGDNPVNLSQAQLKQIAGVIRDFPEDFEDRLGGFVPNVPPARNSQFPPFGGR